MNYTWDNIILENFIKASDGEIKHVAINGEVNDETLDAWFAIQDEYIALLELESIEIKRYKKLCYKYAIALQEWINNPNINSRSYSKVNQLYIEKTKLSNQIFTEEKRNWDQLIAQATLSTKQRISANQWLAKEFFNLIRLL